MALRVVPEDGGLVLRAALLLFSCGCLLKLHPGAVDILPKGISRARGDTWEAQGPIQCPKSNSDQ